MSLIASAPVVTALSTPGHLTFSDNRLFKTRLEAGDGRVVRQATGHLVFYRPDGRRILATDPSGNALHECEWGVDQKGETVLVRARIRLDWGAWVGLRPSGLVNETTLNLATKPGWQRLTADDLRAMAAQALRVPLDEVRWFYRDEDLSISRTGVATIRHRKDAWYVLEQGNFDRARFMSCMGAMHWASVDFLPVVELFKSLLPGTGSAAFELIRGLYDDQNEGLPNPLPLRYRGIPAYPSEAAFRLFKSFFVPQAPPGKDALSLFMDSTKTHQVQWLPSATPPARYFDRSARVCLTIQQHELQKVTLAEDAAGLSFMNPKGRAFLPCDRAAQAVHGRIVLKDRDAETTLATTLPAAVNDDPTPSVSISVSPLDWRSVFVDGLPHITPEQAYGAVLLYPDDEAPIGELAAQPFVADYLEDLAEQDRVIGRLLGQANRVLIHNGDAVVATCIAFDRPREYSVAVREPAFAQKQAQQLWTTSAQLRRWDWLKAIRFLPIESPRVSGPSPETFDVVYQWLPIGLHDRQVAAMTHLRRALRPGGHAFVTGPATLREHWKGAGFQLVWEDRVEQLPTFRMHRAILPKARLQDELTLFFVQAA
jgi:SAM-dependent methyltransferase